MAGSRDAEGRRLTIRPDGITVAVCARVRALVGGGVPVGVGVRCGDLSARDASGSEAVLLQARHCCKRQNG